MKAITCETFDGPVIKPRKKQCSEESLTWFSFLFPNFIFVSCRHRFKLNHINLAQEIAMDVQSWIVKFNILANARPNYAPLTTVYVPFTCNVLLKKKRCVDYGE